MNRKLVLFWICLIILFIGFSLPLIAVVLHHPLDLPNDLVFSLQVVGVILIGSMMFPVALLAPESEDESNPYEKSKINCCPNCGFNLKDD